MSQLLETLIAKTLHFEKFYKWSNNLPEWCMELRNLNYLEWNIFIWNDWTSIVDWKIWIWETYEIGRVPIESLISLLINQTFHSSRPIWPKGRTQLIREEWRRREREREREKERERERDDHTWLVCSPFLRFHLPH